MIDTLVEQLAKEQTDDDAHKAWSFFLDQQLIVLLSNYRALVR